jgi:cytochrome c biogenesis protein CcdA
MVRWSALKETLVLAVTSWQLWLLQFLGNVVIFLVFAWWLRTPDAHWWQLVFQALLVVFGLAAALVLHGGTMDFFQIAHHGKEGTLATAFHKAVRHLPAIALWAVIFFLLRWLLGTLDAYAISLPGYLRSELPAWLRRMISEPRLDSIYSGVIWLIRWVILPGVMLPFALFCADQGFRGFTALRDWWRLQRSLSYWIGLLIAALLGVTATQAIMDWKLDPKTATLQAEQVSLFFRLLFAYLLGIFSWLLACSMLGRKAVGTAGESGAQPV